MPRPILTHTNVAGTFAQAACLLKTSVPVLKRARDAGAPGFVHSRFQLSVIGEWLAKHPEFIEADFAGLSPQMRAILRLKRQVQAHDEKTRLAGA